MIELFYWTTPNGHKLTIFLEESGLPYKITPVNISQGEQFNPDFLRIAPNNRIPAMIDHAPIDAGEPISIFESGAILLYLADKIKKFIPQNLRGRQLAIQWLFWQMANLGPMSGQNAHFSNYANEKIPYAIDRYRKETSRLYEVLNQQLADQMYIANEYSIADMACYPWIVPYESQNQNIDDFPHLKRWFLNMQKRPAIERAYSIAKEINPQPNPQPNFSEETKRILFGQDAKTIRDHKKE